MNRSRIGFITRVHPFYDLPAVAAKREQAVVELRKTDCQVVEAAIPRTALDALEIAGVLKQREIDLAVLFFCTWVSRKIKHFAKSRKRFAGLQKATVGRRIFTVPTANPICSRRRPARTGCKSKCSGRASPVAMDEHEKSTLRFGEQGESRLVGQRESAHLFLDRNCTEDCYVQAARRS